MSSARLPPLLFCAYGVVWVLCAIEPRYPSDWLLENVLVFAFVPVIAWHWRRAPVSTGAYVALFLFMCLHSLGSHYTYAEVPYDSWWRALTGHAFNELVGWQRNNYDRVVHFGYGLLTTPVWREILLRHVRIEGAAWRFIVPLTFMMSHGMLYELVEWLAAEQFGGGLGEAYLGTQGDNWDAHKDMALATLGSVLALGVFAWHERRGGGLR